MKTPWNFGWKVLWADLNNYFTARRDIKYHEKLLGEFQKKGISNPTNKTNTEIFEETVSAYQSIVNLLLEISGRLGLPIHQDILEKICLEIEENPDARNLAWEAQIQYGFPHRIVFNQGTEYFIEFVALFYASLAGKMPAISDLKEYHLELGAFFRENLRNSRLDSRNIIERITRPNSGYWIGSRKMKFLKLWTPVKNHFMREIKRLMTIFLIGHELGHLVIFEQWKNGCFITPYYENAVEFCRLNNLPLNDHWIDEFICDTISFNMALYYLDERPIHRLYKKGFLNEFTVFFSRGEPLLGHLDFEARSEEEGKEHLARWDEKVGLLAAIRMLFWSLIDVGDDEPSPTHPRHSDRIRMIEWYAVEHCRFPPIVLELANGPEMLRRSVLEGGRREDLDHPLLKEDT